jgi:rRNA maturation protein Nop10
LFLLDLSTNKRGVLLKEECLMGMTGSICQQSGVYKCPKCSNEIPLAKGNRFPPCNKHGAVNWKLVRKA